MTGAAPAWSAVEVRETVADYFAMLECELRGQPYSKAAHRRDLARRLHGRSEAAIERKRQNISAVLLEMELPYIDGCKPLPHVQGLLREAVLEYLSPAYRIDALIDTAESAPPARPLPDDLSGLLTPVPPPLPALPEATADCQRVGRRIDFARREAANRELGRQGEEFVLAWESERLRQAGRVDLSRRVEWVSQVQGDGLGYDIASFDAATGEPIAVEVKTTRGGAYHPFFVTRAEADVSGERGSGRPGPNRGRTLGRGARFGDRFAWTYDVLVAGLTPAMHGY